MPLRGIQNAAHGLSYYARLQEVVANNLGNVSTDGFKLDRLTGQLGPDGTWPTPVQAIDLRQGALRPTGRDLDVALDGDGFLVVRTPAGERLTRGGALAVAQDGTLTDGDGNPVLGLNGPIIIGTGQLEIRADGEVLVDGASIDTLRLETVPDPTTLRKEGTGRFVADVPFVKATGLAVRQGEIEEPNTDAVLGMVDLVTIQRAYAANADALKAMDGVLNTIVSDVGRVG